MKSSQVSKLIVGIVLSLSFLTSCFDGGGGGGGGITPDYSNSGLPRTDTQEWLIMYYCDADNDLEEVLMNDLNEMESVNLSGKKIRIVALVDRNASYWTGDGDWNDTRAYEIEYDSAGYNQTLVSKRIAIEPLGISRNTTTELNMGSGTTLTEFIKFCNTNYPATKKMLLLSNHGGGWRDNPEAKKRRLEKIGLTKGVCWDETNGDDYLSASELRTAIASALGTGNKLDIIAFDACLMGMVEVAYELKDVANYMVASQETIPGFGFPYTQILTAYKDTLTSEQFGRVIINNFNDAYINGSNVEDRTFQDNSVTLSLTDLSKIDALAVAINKLGEALDSYYSSNPSIDMRLQTESFENIDYMDIRDFCAKETRCQTERNAVTTAFDAAVIYNMAGSGNSGAKGLSIYMPLKWLDKGEQPDYTSANIQFARTAPSWRTYLMSITSPTATDRNEILEYEYGSVTIDVPAAAGNIAETGYIYFNNDEDLYVVNSDGTVRVTLTGGVTGQRVIIAMGNKTTFAINILGAMDTEKFYDVPAYDPAQFDLLLIVYGPTSTSNAYTLSLTNI